MVSPFFRTFAPRKENINNLKTFRIMEEITISADELEHLKAYQNVVGLCPNCKKAMLLEGLICPHCGYDNSSSVEEWKQTHKDEN